MRATRFKELIELLTAAGVEFILVGGVAASALGSPVSRKISTWSTGARRKT